MHLDFWCPIDAADVVQGFTAIGGSLGLKGGVYRLHALAIGSAASPVFAPVPRAGGTDPDGTLYIGAAADFEYRFMRLRKTLLRDYADTHGAGLRYLGQPPLQRAFPRLGATLRFSNVPLDAEREELSAYCTRFGELPPLNQADGRQASPRV